MAKNLQGKPNCNKHKKNRRRVILNVLRPPNVKARDGEKQRGENANPRAAHTFPNAINQRNCQYTKRDGDESPGEGIRAGDEIPKVEKPIMQRRMLVHRRAKSDPRQIFLREPDTPALVPPNIFIGETIASQKERNQHNAPNGEARKEMTADGKRRTAVGFQRSSLIDHLNVSLNPTNATPTPTTIAPRTRNGCNPSPRKIHDSMTMIM